MKTFHVFITLLLTVLAVSGELETFCAKEGSSRSVSIRIKKKILCNYDKEYRPIKNQKEPINVSLRMFPRYLDSVSEEDGTMSVQNWLGLVWKDEFFTWNPDDYESVRFVHVSSNDIWTPDFKLFKDEQSDEDTIFDDASCVVSHTGSVTCAFESEHEAQCTQDVVRWPYDTRKCELMYTTGVYNTSEVQIKKNGNRLALDGLQPNMQWELISSGVDLSSYKKMDQTYQLVTYNFNMKRHSSRTSAIIIVPALSLITMTLIPLWMKPENTERFCLIAADLISHFLFIMHVVYMTPTLGTKLPRTVQFFRDSLGIAIVVLFELTIVKSLLAGRTASPTWLLAPCKLVASRVVGKTLLTENVQKIPDEETITQNDNNEIKMKQIQGERCLIVAVIDKILFFVLSIVYFVLVMLLIPFN